MKMIIYALCALFAFIPLSMHAGERETKSKEEYAPPGWLYVCKKYPLPLQFLSEQGTYLSKDEKEGVREKIPWGAIHLIAAFLPGPVATVQHQINTYVHMHIMKGLNQKPENLFDHNLLSWRLRMTNKQGAGAVHCKHFVAHKGRPLYGYTPLAPLVLQQQHQPCPSFIVGRHIFPASNDTYACLLLQGNNKVPHRFNIDSPYYLATPRCLYQLQPQEISLIKNLYGKPANRESIIAIASCQIFYPNYSRDEISALLAQQTTPHNHALHNFFRRSLNNVRGRVLDNLPVEKFVVAPLESLNTLLSPSTANHNFSLPAGWNYVVPTYVVPTNEQPPLSRIAPITWQAQKADDGTFYTLVPIISTDKQRAAYCALHTTTEETITAYDYLAYQQLLSLPNAHLYTYKQKARALGDDALIFNLLAHFCDTFFWFHPQKRIAFNLQRKIAFLSQQKAEDTRKKLGSPLPASSLIETTNAPQQPQRGISPAQPVVTSTTSFQPCSPAMNYYYKTKFCTAKHGFDPTCRAPLYGIDPTYLVPL